MAFKTDVVQLVDKYASLIDKSAKSVPSRATEVISLRLSLDCLLLQDEMKEILKPEVYRGRVTSTFHLSDLWNLIESHTWAENNTSLVRAVLRAIPHAATLDIVDSKSFEGKDVDRVKRFSTCVSEIQHLIVIFFSKIMDFRPQIIRSLLEDGPACVGIVAHLLNAKQQKLENADLDLLKTAFDCSGKFELWRELLRDAFEPSLRPVVMVSRHVLAIQRVIPPEKLKHWHRIYLLTYVGKIIKQSMEIVDILCSGRSGILTTTDILSNDCNAQALETFWRAVWEILNIAFLSATSWAAQESKDVMKNFLRDVLEAASVLFDSLKVLDATFSGHKIEQPSPTRATPAQARLLKDVQLPLLNLSKWLVLNVDDLRETTLSLAIKILSRFARSEIVVREDTLVQYYRLAHGKKKNNMTEEQRERLLVSLSEHDVDPHTRKTVEAMAATRIAASIPQARTPELAKVGAREIIDMTGDDEYEMGYISEREMNEIMAQFEKVQQQQQQKTPSATLKQTKMDFSKGTFRPPVTSREMMRTSSLPSKSSFPQSKAIPASTASSGLAQLRADFNRTKTQPVVKKAYRAPVAAPRTDGFGRPLAPIAPLQIPEATRPAPKKIEESSSSESDSDDADEDGGGLFSIAKENKSPPKLRQIQKRQVRLLGEPVHSRLALQAKEREFGRVSSERNLRARLEPDLTVLMKRVLSWPPAHPGPFPPYQAATDFKRVEPSFSSPAKYEQVFEPLLILECWQHIQQAKTEIMEEAFEFLIDNRGKIDDYVELFVTMKPLVYNRVGLLDPDLVIISNVKGTGGKECFAKVQGMKRKKDSVELVLRCLPSFETAAMLVPKATLYGVKLFRYIVCFKRG